MTLVIDAARDDGASSLILLRLSMWFTKASSVSFIVSTTSSGIFFFIEGAASSSYSFCSYSSPHWACDIRKRAEKWFDHFLGL